MEAARRAIATGQERLALPATRLRRLAQAQGVVVAAALAAVGFAEGGLLPRTWRLATIAFLALAAAALVSAPSSALSRLERATLAAAGGLALWTALSAAWSLDASASLLQAERVLVYAAALLAFLLLAEARFLPQLLAGVLAGVTVPVAYGLVRYLVAPPPLDRFEGRLLYQPFGYANALGIVAAVGTLLALGLAAWAPADRTRAAALAPLAVLLPALALTGSRGAWVALAAGLAVGVAARGGARAAAGALAVLAATGLLVAVVAGSAHSQSLVHVAGENRPHYWHVAVLDWERHPALGSGAGTYGEYRRRHYPFSSFTRTAHSLYLETLAELGPVGLGLVGAALGLPLLALRRRRDPLVVAAAAAYTASLVHTGIDWDWELPGATLPGLLAGGALMLAVRGSPPERAPARLRPLLLAVVLAVAAVEAVRIGTGPATPFGG